MTATEARRIPFGPKGPKNIETALNYQHRLSQREPGSPFQDDISRIVDGLLDPTRPDLTINARRSRRGTGPVYVLTVGDTHLTYDRAQFEQFLEAFLPDRDRFGEPTDNASTRDQIEQRAFDGGIVLANPYSRTGTTQTSE